MKSKQLPNSLHTTYTFNNTPTPLQIEQACTHSANFVKQIDQIKSSEDLTHPLTAV